MLNYRNVNIFFVLYIICWIWLDRRYNFSPSAYAWILLVYVTVLFCGTYFIRLGFFFKSHCSGDPAKKEIALSFDDGPDASLTARVLDILKEQHAESIFFCIGRKIRGNEDLLLRIVGEGHLIGNHSYSHHPLFDLFSPHKMQEELEETGSITRMVTNLTPRLFRPPYGVTNPSLKKAVERSGLISIGWNLRSYDTMIHREDRLIKHVLRKMKPGSILLLHDTCETTVKILDRLINEIKQQGYDIVRLDKMLKLEPYA